MRVLWISNILFPEAEQVLTGKSVLKGSGGWMLGSAKALLEFGDIELAVATITKRVSHLTIIKGEHLTYYCLPYGKGNLRENHEYEPIWCDVHNHFRPDVTHIHGTEFSHGLSYLKACGTERCVISIQGLVSAYQYYYYGLTKGQIIKNITLGDIAHGGGILHAAASMKARSKIENTMLSMVHHVIGRTSWDRAHIWAINPNAKYHFCNETLREDFYSGQWEYSKCNPHTIFISQATYPIKGLHQLLRALPLVRRDYPDVRIRIAGRDITKHSYTLRGVYLYSGYGRIIKKTIQRLGLSENVAFLGALDGGEMKSEYLRANVFICSSTVENSPNSLGEAQILGVPCIASYVGGVKDMIPTSECGYTYRFEDIEMLAKLICDVFTESELFNNTKMRSLAQSRHDARSNAITLFNIYSEILNK